MKKISSLLFAVVYSVMPVAAICAFLSCGEQGDSMKKKLEEATNRADKFQAGFNRLEKEKNELKEKLDKVEEKNLDFNSLCDARIAFYDRQELFKKKNDLEAKKKSVPPTITPAEDIEFVSLNKEVFDILGDLTKLTTSEDKEFKRILGRK